MRHYFQFSIRSLLILTTLSAGLCAWGVPAARDYVAKRERERLLAEQRKLQQSSGVYFTEGGSFFIGMGR